MMSFILSDHQRALIERSIGSKIFLEGPAGTGKTTAGVRRLLHLLGSGVPAGTILMIVGLEYSSTDENEPTEEDAATSSVCSGFQWLQCFQDAGRWWS
jgi:hypothetical protein